MERREGEGGVGGSYNGCYDLCCLPRFTTGLSATTTGTGVLLAWRAAGALDFCFFCVFGFVGADRDADVCFSSGSAATSAATSAAFRFAPEED